MQVDLCADDFIADALPTSDGGFLAAGAACGEQADTGSLLKYEVGYVLALGADGKPVSVDWFTGERDTQVQALAASPTGELAVAGIRNGPITHTDPSQFSNEGWVALTAAPTAAQ